MSYKLTDKTLEEIYEDCDIIHEEDKEYINYNFMKLLKKVMKKRGNLDSYNNIDYLY